jgi:Raf kinase inhibitor-like YbhB/YbcL family protein
MSIQLTSTSFKDGATIPGKHTCDGVNSSPPLQWANLPQGTQSLAFIADDPDAPAGIWVHWVLYNLAPSMPGLPESVGTTETVLDGARQGINDFRRIGYGGPCPPRGKPHRYFFKIYALDTLLTLKAGATKTELIRAMEGHILAEGQLMGTYKRA